MSINGQTLLSAHLADYAKDQLQAVRQVALDSHKKRKEQERRVWEKQKAEAEIRQAYRDRQWLLSRGGK